MAPGASTLLKWKPTNKMIMGTYLNFAIATGRLEDRKEGGERKLMTGNRSRNERVAKVPNEKRKPTQILHSYQQIKEPQTLHVDIADT